MLPIQIAELEQDKRDLERQVNELKAKCEQIEKRAAEQRQVEEKKHQDEIQFLKRNNQQLKCHVDAVIAHSFRLVTHIEELLQRGLFSSGWAFTNSTGAPKTLHLNVIHGLLKMQIEIDYC
ncbi:unnamed protein product [Protopolystoma xenopodis]|uniref:Uncharacterized protein n=1 Tax=Protopolystoma xenopodis TaxID=117903 RepID=A0A3S5BKQ1_9PLAT|nr:unnamed protein product [Protopolystoma xenopodis]